MTKYRVFSESLAKNNFGPIRIGFFKLSFLVLSILFWNSQKSTGNDSIPSESHNQSEFSHDNLKLGERLFYGLIQSADNQISCAGCHYFFQGDTMNWNPSAYDIAKVVSESDVSSFKNSLLNPTGTKLSEVHANIQLTDEQINQLRGFLIELHKKGVTPSKPIITHILIVIGLLVLIILVILDLKYKRVLRFKIIHLLIILGAAGLITKYIAVEAISLGRSQNYEPDQPIKFSHKVHVTQNKIDCKYCHSTVEYSKTAGIPSTNVCMNCHIVVREGSRSGKFEINKIIKAMDTNTPVSWVKVHNLPDFVFFSHAQHVGVGKLDCKVCHGDVGSMDRVKQVSDLSMGWCVNCHRETKVQFVDNAFYDKYTELHKKLKEGKIDKVTVENIGGLDCMKCHY